MNWFIWILISVVTTAVANIFQRVVMREKDSDAYGTNVVFLFLLGIMTGLFALWKGFVLPPLGLYFWNFLLGAFLWGFGSYTLFKAYQTLGSSEVAIISSLGSVVTIISAIALLGESFNMLKIIGTVLILISIFLVNRPKKKLQFRKGTNSTLQRSPSLSS